MNELQKKIRRWFRNRKWHTGVPPSGFGAWLEMPVQKSFCYWGYDKQGNRISEEKVYCWYNECLPVIEIDRFSCDYASFSICKRRVYTDGPDFEKKNKPFNSQVDVYFKLDYKELKKLVELMEACMQERKEKT